jgi:hypothetical protein
MEIPAPWAGVVTEINIALGDKIKQGDVLLALQTEEDSAASSEESIAEVVNTEPKIIPVMVPDIGDFDEVEVIEVLVNAGDELSANFIKVTNIWHHHRYDFWFSINHFCDYFFPGMPVATRADKISHGLCLFPCYLYTFAMIPFFAPLYP